VQGKESLRSIPFAMCQTAWTTSEPRNEQPLKRVDCTEELYLKTAPRWSGIVQLRAKLASSRTQVYHKFTYGHASESPAHKILHIPVYNTTTFHIAYLQRDTLVHSYVLLITKRSNNGVRRNDACFTISIIYSLVDLLIAL
jgi:hypothetical protein